MTEEEIAERIEQERATGRDAALIEHAGLVAECLDRLSGRDAAACRALARQEYDRTRADLWRAVVSMLEGASELRQNKASKPAAKRDNDDEIPF